MSAARSPLPKPARTATRWVAAAALVVMVALASPRPADAVRLFGPTFYKLKEFDIVREAETFHLFYILQDLRLVTDSTTVELGHSISSDLVNWVEQAPVLRIRKDKWDNSHVWAPSIVKRNGLWYMFYTGVTSIPNQFNYHQRTGVAVSADLWNWQRFDAPVWACSNVPWVYCNPLTIDGGDFRDPCVIPEPGQPGSWLMYYACRPAVAQDQMMISVARSTDLMNWANVKPLWNTTQYRTFSPLIESPELLERNGLWYLFYTTNSGHALSYQMSSDPLADSTGWSAQFRLSQEIPEVSTDPWFGIEFFRDAGHDYLLAANGGLRCIEIHEVVWDDPPHFHLIEPTAYGMTAGAPLPPVGGALALERIASGGVSAARFRITLPAASNARLDVIDLQGRPVHTLIAAPLLSGSTEVAWDGAGRDGRTAPTGIYFARLSSGSEQRTLKFARVR